MMPCCGGKRSQVSSAAAAGEGNGSRPPRRAVAALVEFEYFGRTAMTVLGPITGQRYRFGAPGARVVVDARDAPSLLGVPNLRRSASGA